MCIYIYICIAEKEDKYSYKPTDSNYGVDEYSYITWGWAALDPKP